MRHAPGCEDVLTSLFASGCSGSVFRNTYRQAIQLIAEWQLAGKTGRFAAIGRTIEEVVLVGFHRWQAGKPLGRDVDVAGSTAAASAAHRKKLIRAGISDDLHNRVAGLSLDLKTPAVASQHDESRHQSAALGTITGWDLKMRIVPYRLMMPSRTKRQSGTR